MTGRIRWVQIDLGQDAEDADHMISPEERMRVALRRQQRAGPGSTAQPNSSARSPGCVEAISASLGPPIRRLAFATRSQLRMYWV